MSPTTISIRATPFELVQGSLSETKDVLLTHLVVWLLTLLAGIFLGLRFFAIWYRKLVLVLDDALLMASWVSPDKGGEDHCHTGLVISPYKTPRLTFPSVANQS